MDGDFAWAGATPSATGRLASAIIEADINLLEDPVGIEHLSLVVIERLAAAAHQAPACTVIR